MKQREYHIKIYSIVRFIIAMIVLLLFGNRLPSVMRSMGKGIVEFKKGVKGIEDEVEQASQTDDTNNVGSKVEQ